MVDWIVTNLLGWRLGTLSVASVVIVLLSSAIHSAAGGELSGHDKLTAIRALELAKKSQWASYRRSTSRITHPDLKLILVWNLLRNRDSDARYSELDKFLDSYPGWPERDLIRRRAEELMPAHLTDQMVLDWFRGRSPLTSTGGARLASVLLDVGRKDEAQALLRQVWVKGAFGAKQERQFYKRFRRYLTRGNHIQRLDRLLWNGQIYGARRMYRRVNSDYRALAEARIALRRFRGGVDMAIARVPVSLKRNVGLVYERLRWRRRKGRDQSARKLLVNAPEDLVRPHRWWRESEILVRRALRDGHISEAYRIAKNHGQLGGSGFAEGEWLAGWIALRFLGDTEVAFGHFNSLYTIAKFPISRARGAYWSARAAAKQKKSKLSVHWYKQAAQFQTTYYGQLSRERLDRDGKLALPLERFLDDVERRRFNEHKLVRLVQIMELANLRSLMRPFIRHLLDNDASPGWVAETARLATEVGRPDLAVFVAKVGLSRGMKILSVGYPRLASSALDRDLELALTHALIRQESAFNPEAVSHAGARGLMQLMPATAKQVAKRYKIPYRQSRLLSDLDYNLRIGQTFLKELLQTYNNSYVLTLAAYNAGPNRVQRWVNLNGDPRDPSVDAIDWVELIPYSETRNYVQRVMENLHIYRELINGTEMAFTPESLLKR